MRKVKWFFSLTMVGVFVLFIASSVAIDDTLYANENIVFAEAQAAWHRMKYSFVSAPNVLAAVDNVFNEPETYDRNAGPAAAIPVLNYHGILPSWDGTEANMSKDRFEEHMFALKEAGYQTITLADLYAFIRGEHDVPQKAVLITFDDGRRDSIYNADPILRGMGYTAAMFIVSKFSTGESGGGYYLSEDELRHIRESGVWELGAHAYEGHADSFPLDDEGQAGNFYSNKLWLTEEGRLETDREYVDRTASDLIRAKELLESAINEEVTGFAFPFGEFGQIESNAPHLMPRMISIAHSMYDMLFYQHAPGVYFRQVYAEPSTDDTSFLIRRISVKGDWTAERLMDTLEKSSAKPLPYSDTLKVDRGWISSWGSFEIDPSRGGLELVAREGQAGASAILDGTGHWRNYEVTARVESPTQSGAFMWFRFKDDDNNAACNFGAEFAHVEQTVAGEHRVINGIRESGLIPEEPFTIGVRVNGRTVECMLNGRVVARSSFLDPSLTRGGIGFKKWNQTPGMSSLTIRQLEVTSITHETPQEP